MQQKKSGHVSIKGQSDAEIIQRDFPHIVEIVVPASGLGKQLDAMYD